MRIYHTAFRQKNPPRRAGLHGSKKELHGDLMRALKNPGKPGRGRRKNPGKSIEAFNLLGELNRRIDEGETDLIPLRDTVAARIEGYLDEGALSYSLEEAMRDLTAARVRAIKRMLAEAGGDVSPEEGRLIRERAEYDPEVMRARHRAERAEVSEKKMKEMFQRAIARNQINLIEWQRGERASEMKAADDLAAKEMGIEKYRPANKELWERVSRKIESRYPNGYVPPSTKSRMRDEFKILAILSPDIESPRYPSGEGYIKVSEKEKKNLKKRLEIALSRRLEAKKILAYEAAGGRQLSNREIQAQRELDRMGLKELGKPFKINDFFYGIVEGSGNQYKWYLVEERGRVIMSGTAGRKDSASKSIGIAARVVENLVMMEDDEVGWDNMPEPDRRWIEKNVPTMSRKVSKLLVRNMGKRYKVPPAVMKSILKTLKAKEIARYKKEEDPKMARGCEGMSVGEERVFRGKNNAYKIIVRRGMRNKYTMWVIARDGKESAKRRLDGCETAVARGHMIGGAMVGVGKVAGAIENPAKIKRLNNEARRFFAKKNPKIPRTPAEEDDIQELTGMITIPENNEDAFRYGLYFGIIRGIDTCGVQNYMKRKRIRRKYQERLIEGAMSEAFRAGGISKGKTKSSKKGSSSSFSDSDIASILADLD